MTQDAWSVPVSDATPRSSWPLVVGIISIVLGASGSLCWGCTSVSSMVQPFLLGALPEDQRPPTSQGVSLALQLGEACLFSILGVWLIVAGGGLCGRRSWARGQHVAWGWTKAACTVVVTVLSFIFMDELLQDVNQQMAGQPGGTAPFQFTKPVMIAFALIGFVISMTWPVFLLIWFRRPAVRAEAATWRAGS